MTSTSSSHPVHLNARFGFAAATLAVAAAAFSPASFAQTQDPVASPVVVIVKVPKPWYAPRSVVLGKMRDTLPQYADLPGLMFKAFSFERTSGDYGGVYYWRDRASAQAWFNTAWFDRVKKERGHEASVQFVDAPLTLDNTPGGTQASPAPGICFSLLVCFDNRPDVAASALEKSAVVTHVQVAVPAGVTQAQISTEFAKAVPVYQKIPGLLRKHFTLTDQGTFGGVYIWRDEASAKAWFNDAWHQRVITTYGQDAKIEWFDAPILLPTQNSKNTLPTSALITVAP